MKIIQLVTAVNGESPGSFESQLLGLGDDGGLYEYVAQRRALARNYLSQYIAEDQIRGEFLKGKTVHFSDGSTGGWQLICMSIDRPKAIPHPLDPTRAERA
jgi:hypothetical protein